MLLGVGLLMAGWLLAQERVVAPWFVGVATAGGLVAFVSARSLAERRDRRREEPDALSAYRACREVIEFRCQSFEEVGRCTAADPDDRSSEFCD